MRDLRYITRPVVRPTRESGRHNRDITHQPLVETLPKVIPNTSEKPLKRTESRPYKPKTNFSSRALWRHSYARCRKAKMTAERAAGGDWRVWGLNRTPYFARQTPEFPNAIIARERQVRSAASGAALIIEAKIARRRVEQPESGNERLGRYNNHGTAPHINQKPSGLSTNFFTFVSDRSVEEKTVDLEQEDAARQNGSSENASSLSGNTNNLTQTTQSKTDDGKATPTVAAVVNTPTSEEEGLNVNAVGASENSGSVGYAIANIGVANTAAIANSNCQVHSSGIEPIQNRRVTVHLETTTVSRRKAQNSRRSGAQQQKHDKSGNQTINRQRIHTEKYNVRRSKYVQTYSRRIRRKLKVVQASIQPPEN